MLPFFTNPYPDELIYSAIARYHFYSGNIDCKDTLEEVFQNRSAIPSVEIGSYFSHLSKQLGPNYTVESILANHTIYPFYAMFLSKQRQQNILQDVVGDGKGIYARLGMVAGSICKKDGLYYCAECAKSDVSQYGEPYIHREHQLQSISYCAHHEILLRKYEVGPTSRIEYIRFEIDKMDLSPTKEEKPYSAILIYLAKQAYKMFQIPLHQISREKITLMYRAFLRERNLITIANRVRQKELYQDFRSIFPIGFIEKHECDLDLDKEYNWLKVLTRNLKRHVHPFRHLLMFYFIQQDVGNFIDFKTDEGPFGHGPFPCLNQSAPHYKQRVISKVEVTRDYKTKSPIGTFRCSCGFEYSRKGPDISLEDQFRIGRIKVFGEVWQAKLEILARENLSVRGIARKLGVDFKTVKKYLREKKEINRESHQIDMVRLQQYQSEIFNAIKKTPYLSRTELRDNFKKQYIFLYRHDKQWLLENLPCNKMKQLSNKKVDWTKRDKEYVEDIKNLCKQLLKQDKMVRITVSVIGKQLGILANLERHLNKMPNTKELLEEISESLEQFQIRRCCKVIDHMLSEDKSILLWKVQRIASVKTHHFYRIKPQLESYIKYKQDVSNDGTKS